MILNLIVIGVVLGLGYLWASRGMFNALLHTVCVLFAGAIAFGMWETVANILMDMTPNRGFLSFLDDVAWAVGLIVPFAVSLFVLRLISDSLVRANVKLPFLPNLLGGLVASLPGSIVTAGVLVIGLSFLRLGPGLLGYQPVNYTERGGTVAGQLERTAGLWIPADRITAALYRHTSEHTFSTGQPLARWYPDLELAGHTGRMTYRGESSVSLAQENASLAGRYILGDNQQGSAVADLLSDRQGAMTLAGEPIARGYVEGFVIDFEPGAQESFSQVVMGNGQVRLVTEHQQTGERLTLHPIAVVSEQRQSTGGGYARFAFEAKDQFVPTQGSDAAKSMAFEFFIPTGHQGIALYVRTARFLVGNGEGATEEGPARFATPFERDAGIPTLMGGARLASLDTTNAATLDDDGRGGYEIVSLRSSFGDTLQSSTVRSELTLNDENEIVSGELRIPTSGLANRSIASQLRVRNFDVPNGTRIFQLTVSGTPDTNPASLLGDLIRTAPAQESTLHLVDTDNRTYQAVGYVSNDGTFFQLRYTPVDPITNMVGLPSLSPTNPDDTDIRLVFRVTVGVQIKAVAINDQALVVFDTPIPITRQ